MFKRFWSIFMMVGLLTHVAHAHGHTSQMAKHVNELKKFIMNQHSANELLLELSGMFSIATLMITAFGLFADDSARSFIKLDDARFFAKLFAASGLIALYQAVNLKRTGKEITALTAIEEELNSYV